MLNGTRKLRDSAALVTPTSKSKQEAAMALLAGSRWRFMHQKPKQKLAKPFFFFVSVNLVFRARKLFYGFVAGRPCH